MKTFHPSLRSRTRKPRGFTLIEIMVALAILMLMLTIILVPINLGARITHIGTARADVQQASQQLLNRIAGELRQAVYVYPNDALPGVTDRAPFNNNLPNRDLPPNPPPTYRLGFPYYRQTGSSTAVCTTTGRDTTLEATGNTSRIDFLLPRRSGDVLLTPVAPEYYMVTYFARRLDTSKSWNSNPNPYHPIDNPVVMYRAQYPYRDNNGGTYFVGNPADPNKPNALTDGTRYPSGIPLLANDCTMASTNSKLPYVNRGALWLTQNFAGEPNLVGEANPDKQPQVTNDLRIVQESAVTPPASLQLVTPRDMGLVAPRASLQNTTDFARPMRSYQPSTTFIGDDTNDDGKIDRISISLVLAQFDSGGSEPRSQPVRLPMTVDLTNVR